VTFSVVDNKKNLSLVEIHGVFKEIHGVFKEIVIACKNWRKINNLLSPFCQTLSHFVLHALFPVLILVLYDIQSTTKVDHKLTSMVDTSPFLLPIVPSLLITVLSSACYRLS